MELPERGRVVLRLIQRKTEGVPSIYVVLDGSCLSLFLRSVYDEGVVSSV